MNSGLQIALQLLSTFGSLIMQAAQTIIGFLEKQQPNHPAVAVLQDVVKNTQTVHDKLLQARAELDKQPL